jgi:hypothetical protein
VDFVVGVHLAAGAVRARVADLSDEKKKAEMLAAVGLWGMDGRIGYWRCDGGWGSRRGRTSISRRFSGGP